MTDGSEVDADLMGTPSARNCSEQGELFSGACRSCKSPLNTKLSLSLCTRRMNHLFQPNRRRLMFALSIQRRIDRSLIPIRPAENNREILLFQSLLLQADTEPARPAECFRRHHTPASLPIEPIHE